MNPKYRALIWEQRQVAGAITVACFLVAAALMVLLDVMDSPDRFPRMSSIGNGDGPEISLYVAMAMSFLAALLCVLGLDARGHLTTGFDMRLARLPVATLPIVTIALVVRTIALLLMGLALWFVYAFLFEEVYPWYWILAAAEAYLILQALAWSRGVITGLSYPIVFLLVAATLLRVGTGGDLEDLIGDGFRVLTAPPVIVITAPFAFLLALAGVHGHRRDRRYGLPGPTEILDRVRFRSARRDTPFASALDAQIWYEWKRSGWILPGLSLLVWCLLMLLWAALRNQDEMDGFWAQHLPYFAVVLSAVIAGLVSGVPIYKRQGASTPFQELRPIDAAGLANAKLLVKTRSLFYTISGAFLLSLVGIRLLGDAEMVNFGAAWERGDLGAMELVATLTAPALLAGFIAWMLLWINVAMVLGVVLCAGGTAVMYDLLKYYLYYNYGAVRAEPWLEVPSVGIIFSGLLLLLLGLTFAMAVRSRAASRMQIIAAVALWLGAGGFVAFRQYDYYHFDINLLYSLAFAAPLAWPLLITPFALQRLRNR